jgi:hypothetical protein
VVYLHCHAIQPWPPLHCQLTESLKTALETNGVSANQGVNAGVWEKLKRAKMRGIRSIQTGVSGG